MKTLIPLILLAFAGCQTEPLHLPQTCNTMLAVQNGVYCATSVHCGLYDDAEVCAFGLMEDVESVLTYARDPEVCSSSLIRLYSCVNSLSCDQLTNLVAEQQLCLTERVTASIRCDVTITLGE